VILSTQRLLLRAMIAEDLEPLLAITSDPAVMAFVGDGHTLDRVATALWIENAGAALRAGSVGSRAVVLRETSQVIGWAGIIPTAVQGRVELIYGFGRRALGQGLTPARPPPPCSAPPNRGRSTRPSILRTGPPGVSSRSWASWPWARRWTSTACRPYGCGVPRPFLRSARALRARSPAPAPAPPGPPVCRCPRHSRRTPRPDSGRHGPPPRPASR
jgi:hypothetical protein